GTAARPGGRRRGRSGGVAMLDTTTETALDAKLVEFYTLLRWETDLATIAAECEAILDGYAGKSNPAAVLVRASWRAEWQRHGWIASGWFSGRTLTNAMADALFDLFTEMARFALDPELRRLHTSGLKRTCLIYLKRRKIPVKSVRPAKPTARYCILL